MQSLVRHSFRPPVLSAEMKALYDQAAIRPGESVVLFGRATSTLAFASQKAGEQGVVFPILDTIEAIHQSRTAPPHGAQVEPLLWNPRVDGTLPLEEASADVILASVDAHTDFQYLLLNFHRILRGRLLIAVPQAESSSLKFLFALYSPRWALDKSALAAAATTARLQVVGSKDLVTRWSFSNSGERLLFLENRFPGTNPADLLQLANRYLTRQNPLECQWPLSIVELTRSPLSGI